jgi:hypothetical protein
MEYKEPYRQREPKNRQTMERKVRARAGGICECKSEKHDHSSFPRCHRTLMKGDCFRYIGDPDEEISYLAENWIAVCEKCAGLIQSAGS